MPELPEVESVRRGLAQNLSGKVIVGGRVLVPKIIKGAVREPTAFLNAVRGQRVQNVRRRGKYLIFGLGNGYALVSHLKMRGHMRLFRPKTVMPDKFLCVELDLDDGSKFGFYDIWGWGEMRVVKDDDAAIEGAVPALAKMGPEPLSEQFTTDALQKAASKHAKTTIKACLLDQSVLAGVGNIYADESLYRARISPKRRVSELADSEWRRLHTQIRSVLTEAIAQHGTVSDNFFDTEGLPGGYAPQVYGHAGEPCPRCGAKLDKAKVAGRGTVFCPSCQK